MRLARRLLTKWRRPWKQQPHFVPGRACQQNADLAKAEEQKAAARSRYRERREESEGFHRPPAAERRLSIKCARWGREKREVKGDASSERVRGCVIPVRSCRSGGGEPEGRRSWRCPRRLRRSAGPCPRGPEGFGGRRPGEQPAAQGPGGSGGRGSLGLPGREALLPAPGRPRSPGGRDRSCRIPANLACLMNKPAIRLMLPVTLPSSKKPPGRNLVKTLLETPVFCIDTTTAICALPDFFQGALDL
ncbi:uncharacterized protein LOC136003282 [Lathamus discolor]|uniref:uncharacterized protein LOC136003282 n=1 Tax=Lathamus discolor TaxID=678569 RepID=UPI0032B80703